MSSIIQSFDQGQLAEIQRAEPPAKPAPRPDADDARDDFDDDDCDGCEPDFDEQCCDYCDGTGDDPYGGGRCSHCLGDGFKPEFW